MNLEVIMEKLKAALPEFPTLTAEIKDGAVRFYVDGNYTGVCNIASKKLQEHYEKDSFISILSEIIRSAVKQQEEVK